MYVGAAKERVVVSVRVVVAVSGMTTAEGVAVSVIVTRSMNAEVTVGALPRKVVVVDGTGTVTYIVEVVVEAPPSPKQLHAVLRWPVSMAAMAARPDA